ncbi:MAG: hypothetical protein RR405_01075 [Clostridia bacterium]
MTIWAKVFKGDKIIRDTMFSENYPMTQAGFIKALQEIAYRLDIATPVNLQSHFKHFQKFNRIKYLPRDFIEDVDFTSVVLELVLNKSDKSR